MNTIPVKFSIKSTENPYTRNRHRSSRNPNEASDTTKEEFTEEQKQDIFNQLMIVNDIECQSCGERRKK